MRFIHYTTPWFSGSAGVRSTFYFAHLMRQAGYESYVTSLDPRWQTPQFRNFVSPQDIVIYPDCVQNNPLGAKRIVHYMAYYPSVYYGNKQIPPTDYTIVYQEPLFASVKAVYPALTAEDIFTIPTLDRTLFYPETKTIPYAAYEGKGTLLKAAIPSNTKIITRLFPATHEETAALLRKTKVFFCADNYSAINTEALLCGCEVFLLNGMTKIPFTQIDYSIVMDAQKDESLAHRFVKRCCDFFKI